ncbi:MAG TPA: FHA domain-containing protein [Anaerolineales bacterium]|jgi:predicted component of type VI protein secretion system|nr:FHA domain-containing protein [Anaerolineales bacterium]
MAPQTYQLVMETGPTPGKAFALDKPEVHIGRDVNNDVVINDAEVSRRHAQLVAQAGSYVLEDLGSTNGTFVDNQRISGPHLMRPGEAIKLGENVRLRFEAAPYDPDATLVSAAEPYTPAQPQPRETYVPPPPQPQRRETYMPPPPEQEPAYSGQIPPGPFEVEEPFEELAEGRRNLWLWASCGCLIILACVVVFAVLWYIDANILWCDFFPFLPGC